MKRKAKMTQEEIEVCKNIKISSLWVTDEPLKELAILFQNRVTNSCENLKVFCVSSFEYQKLKNKLTDDEPPKVRK
jgi:hypothetical protein